MALNPDREFSTRKRAYLHNVVAKYMNLCAQLLDIPTLYQHVQQVGFAQKIYRDMFRQLKTVENVDTPF